MKKTKLTKEQIEHYLKGGKFRGTYSPKITHDLTNRTKTAIGTKIEAWQNMIICPIVETPQFEGQHAFNSNSINGWFPEEDLADIEIIEEYIDNPEPLPGYMYRLHYSTREQLVENFGNTGKSMELPYVVGRSYSYEMDSYVLGLSTPQADKIEKAIYDGTTENLEWITIFEK